MAEHATTKAQIRRRYARLAWGVSGSLFAAGVGLSLSLILLGTGIMLMALAAAAALVGIGTVALMPRLITFAPHRCPCCGGENEVRVGAGGYRCDSCGSYVRIALDHAAEVRE